MIEIYECTDCKFAVLFGDDAIICKNKKLTPEAVNEYEPVGSNDAADCDEFDEGNPEQLSESSFRMAMAFSEAHPEIPTWAQAYFAWYNTQNLES